MKKFEVKVNFKEGSCDSSLFEKMAKKGDIVAIKITDVINKLVTITGQAGCTIETDDKKFNIYYFDTKEYGLISTGSEIFEESVSDYIDEVSNFRIAEIKTRQGKTYKAVPILKNEVKEEVKEEEKEDLPF